MHAQCLDCGRDGPQFSIDVETSLCGECVRKRCKRYKQIHEQLDFAKGEITRLDALCNKLVIDKEVESKISQTKIDRLKEQLRQAVAVIEKSEG